MCKTSSRTVLLSVSIFIVCGPVDFVHKMSNFIFKRSSRTVLPFVYIFIVRGIIILYLASFPQVADTSAQPRIPLARSHPPVGLPLRGQEPFPVSHLSVPGHVGPRPGRPPQRRLCSQHEATSGLKEPFLLCSLVSVLFIWNFFCCDFSTVQC